jgi:hypothetical protein
MTSAVNIEPLNTACQSQHTYIFNVKKIRKYVKEWIGIKRRATDIT